MKRQRFLKLTLLLLVPLALYFYIAERNSWRPKIIKNTDNGNVIFSPDGNYLLIACQQDSQSRWIDVYNISERKFIITIEHASNPQFLGQGKTLAVFYRLKETRVLSFPEIGLIKQHKASKHNLFSSYSVWPGEQTLAYQDREKNIILWNAQSDEVQRIKLPLPQLKNGLYEGLDFMPDNKTVVIKTIPDNCGWKHLQFQFWDVTTKKRRSVIDCADNGAEFLQATSNGICLLEIEGSVEVWDYFESKRKHIFAQSIIKPVLSPNGAMIASINGSYGNGDDSTITLWDSRSGEELRSLHHPSAHFDSLAFSPDSRTLASCSLSYSGASDTVLLWRVK